MNASMEVDYREDDIGWCIVEECIKYMAAPKGGWLYERKNNFWLLWFEDNEFYSYGIFDSIQEAEKRLEQYESGEIDFNTE